MKNYLLFHTDLMPDKFSGFTIGFVILLRPKAKEDIGLIEHEKVHVAQFWRTLGTFGILYKLSKSYRLKCELEAYTKQLEFCENRDYAKRIFAGYLSANYNLDITYEDALKLF